MELMLVDVNKDNWQYVAFLTTNENKIPTLVEENVNGNAYTMLEVLYRKELSMKAIVIKDGDTYRAVGFASYGPDEDNEGKRVYMLRRFMIDVRFQGQGYGKKALALVMEEMRKQYNCEEIYLSVVPSNEKAIHIYEKAGFVSTGIEIGDETHKEVIYKASR
ncbi:MAG: GNAT family N-acetyltransferase [Lachnospiraceae bacterium]|nr:GNAT family N-acetyltransferase [Lachnospiraceae bacterium]